ncbi:MAG: HEPN domain-containing protein [Chloroflexi bacterium]|nr:HEPN domain-containing protein [Chloroflexota bacterium]
MSEPPPESGQAWLRRARSDLALGRIAIMSADVLPEDACFHAQQCTEKSLKALLVQRAIAFPRTHVLELLLDLLRGAGVDVPAQVDEAFTLTQYAVQTRYPGAWEPVGSEEAEAALAIAAQVLAWVETQIE